MPHLEIVTPDLYADERGTIRTYIPSEPLVEYNVVTISAGQVRGMHWHPHFTEYLLFLRGEGELSWRDVAGDASGSLVVLPGMSTKAVSGVAHAVRAITDLSFIAMLTRRWDDSDPPIIRCDV